MSTTAPVALLPCSSVWDTYYSGTSWITMKRSPSLILRFTLEGQSSTAHLRGHWLVLFWHQLYASKNSVSLTDRKVKFWGHVITSVPLKSTSVLAGNFPRSRLKGFPGYCHQFTAHFTALTPFLTNLLCKNHSFRWLPKTGRWAGFWKVFYKRAALALAGFICRSFTGEANCSNVRGGRVESRQEYGCPAWNWPVS